MMLLSDVSKSSEGYEDSNGVMKQIKELHKLQAQNMLGRIRNEYDWKNLYELWLKADLDNPRSKFMFYLEIKDKDNIKRIAAYVVLHNDPGNKLAQVLFSSTFKAAKNTMYFLLD